MAKDEKNLSLNLVEYLKNHGSVKAELIYKNGLHKFGSFIPGGKKNIIIYPNNLVGGFVGNTLFEKQSKTTKNKSHVVVNIGGFYFFGCEIVIKVGNFKYCLKRKHNYLRLKSKIL